MNFSRRQFLHFTGIALLGHAVGFDIPDAPHYGRAFAATPVYQAPNGSVIGQLWPDSITSLIAANNNWYQVAQGYVRRADMQPIGYDPSAPLAPHIQTNKLAVVTAPSASIREWCAADAPLITRIGHGGVMRVVDYLPGSPNWYGIANSIGERIGWSQASHWHAASAEARTTYPLDLVIQQRTMTIFHGGSEIARTRIATNAAALPNGEFEIRRGLPGSEYAGYHGAPWQLEWANQQILSGVYWHNRFGEIEPGPALQTTPTMAQWLYTHIGPGSRIAMLP